MQYQPVTLVLDAHLLDSQRAGVTRKETEREEGMTQKIASNHRVPPYWPVDWPSPWHAKLLRMGFVISPRTNGELKRKDINLDINTERKGNRNMTMNVVVSLLALTTFFGTGCIPDDEGLVPGDLSQAPASDDESSQNQFLQDARYVRGLVDKRAGRALSLDFADPIQYRFIMERLTRGGRTEAASPILHQSLRKMRQQHLTRTEVKSALTDDYLHMIDETWAEAGDTVHGRAYATEADGTVYSDLDVGLWEVDGSQIGYIGYYSESMGGTEVFAETSGIQSNLRQGSDERVSGERDRMRPSPRRCFQADSLSCHQVVNGPFECTYASRRAECIYPQSIDITAPVDSKPSPALDDVVTVCLDRDWLVDNYDCDYSMVNTGGKLLMPMTGEIDYGFPIVLDPAEPGKPLAAERNYHISMSLPHDGGRCTDVGLNQAVSNFWDFVTIKNGAASDSVLAWNIPQANFGSRCFKHQERANFNLNVSVQVDTGTIQGRVIGAAFITPAGSGNYSPGSVEMPQIRFAYSCLAEGTQISLADGSTVAVESVGLDTLVTSPAAELYVTNSSIGVERIPMVRVRDDQGHSLLLTQGHPIITPKGPVMAGALSVGDRILTESGPGILTFVGREDYAGKVHNLNLGTESHTASHEAMYSTLPEGATMYANGILVGDGRMQGAVQDRATSRSADRDAGPSLGERIRQSVEDIIAAVVTPYR